ncbi:hypothetical protein Patl1_06514 [Pistacia atlantica]|uniref:Uncharacterized protein n=1 Tax=Pistacia atlantica TaxID=434234 RepID=A0ACC1BR54_9ROSI|nr:hypothetical protein Patl1_06514 [Pistacia atlantica]
MTDKENDSNGDAEVLAEVGAAGDGGGGGSGEGSRNGGGSRVKGPWSPEEDAVLSRLVSQFGARNWGMIARGIPGRSGKSCRLRWCNQLDPCLKRKPFTDIACFDSIVAISNTINLGILLRTFEYPVVFVALVLVVPFRDVEGLSPDPFLLPRAGTSVDRLKSVSAYSCQKLQAGKGLLVWMMPHIEA